jgi:predicted HicB family RNase H-like nuclease|nr:MAG TPA: Alginate and motility regulator [Caudoviricetes sp.]
MPTTEAQKMASMRYAKKHLKRVPLDMQLSDYEALKAAAEKAGGSVNGFIKQAITEKLERMN